MTCGHRSFPAKARAQTHSWCILAHGLILVCPGARCPAAAFGVRCNSDSGDVVATSQSLEVEDAVAFEDSVAAIRRHLDDGTSDENVFEV